MRGERPILIALVLAVITVVGLASLALRRSEPVAPARTLDQLPIAPADRYVADPRACEALGGEVAYEQTVRCADQGASVYDACGSYGIPCFSDRGSSVCTDYRSPVCLCDSSFECPAGFACQTGRCVRQF